MQNDLKAEFNLFNNYYSMFDNTNPNIRLKYDHTIRVVDYAKDIAINEKLSYEDLLMATKCALFHDIARFKQIRDYNTFEDAKSFDHGDEGFNVLKELGVLDPTILLSTKYHNKKSVPDEIDDKTKIFCNITRDADKLDIIATQCITCDEVVIPKDVIDSFKNHTLVKNNPDYENNNAFHIFRMIAFIFDMNYERSLEIIKNTNIIQDKFNLLRSASRNENEINIINELELICNKYIDERISD